MKQLLFVLLVCAGFGAFAQKTNFSGSYKVNKDKVNWGQAPEFILPRYIKVDQGKDKVIISRVPLDEDLKELSAVADTLDFKGTIFTKTTVSGKTTSVLKWLNDSSFELSRQSIDQDGELAVSAIETWTLEDSGKTLIISRMVTQGDGLKYTTKAFYDRQ